MIIYLVLPYTHKNKEVEDFRALFSDFVLAELSRQGHTVIAPVSMCHHAARRFGLPTDWKFWEKVDSEILKVCDKLMVVQLPGWEESVGVTAEVKLAKEMEKEIVYAEPTVFMMQMLNSEANKPVGMQKIMDSLRVNIAKDDNLALSWFATLTSVFQEAGVDVKLANAGAKNFMKKAFNKEIVFGRPEKVAPEEVEVKDSLEEEEKADNFVEEEITKENSEE